ncbi:MAG: DUF4136 domain-containing protein [Bacteroidota bacterium]
MKRAVLILLFISLLGCFGYKELPVEYDYSYKGRFDKYKSYDFISSYALKDSDTSLIRSSIEQHMTFLGYKRKERKPDLLLNYAIYQDSLNLRGYDQPDITQWMQRKDRDLEYNQVKFGLTQGTLLIQVFDRKQNSSIWQGYATDEYQSLDFQSYQEVRNAVKSILNKYQFFADGFIEEQMKKAQENN